MNENKAGFAELIKKAFAENSLPVPTDKQIQTLYGFAEHLLQVNEMFNLTAIKDAEGVVYKHLCDSAFASAYIPHGARLLDVGCGAGFPSFPCAILRDDITVLSLDSTAKKVNFINSAAELLGIKNISAICARAEELCAPGKPLRESFDAVTARAVASLPVLTELCMPFVKKNGVFIAMRSGKEDETEAVNAISKTGGDLVLVDGKPLITPTEEMSRKIVLVRKVKSTPNIYPRRYSVISKSPL